MKTLINSLIKRLEKIEKKLGVDKEESTPDGAYHGWYLLGPVSAYFINNERVDRDEWIAAGRPGGEYPETGPYKTKEEYFKDIQQHQKEINHD